MLALLHRLLPGHFLSVLALFNWSSSSASQGRT
ncbi:hypothetical protein ACVWWS_002517 [Pseudomonas chlororaphis]